MSTPIIGVLLPLRLETRFAEPDAPGAGWRLKVRVVPDAASLDRHNPLPLDSELDAVAALWQAVDGGVDALATEHGRAQWQAFAAQVGAARGAWLARSFPAEPAPGGGWRITRPAATSEPLTFARVAGLPKTLQLWLGRGGGAPVRIAELTVDRDRLALDPPDPETGQARWWTSFKEAEQVQLGTTVDLGPDRPDDIDVLYVVGLGEDSPADLFAAHRDAGILGVAALGTATNSVDGARAADLARDPEVWRTLLTAPPPQPGAEAVSAALTGKDSALGPLPGGETDHRPVNQALVGSLWSVLWGHWVKDVWLDGKGLELGAWAYDHLAPEGPLPPIRIGDQPYGVLPVSAPSRWVTAPGDPAVEKHVLRVGLGARDVAATAAEAAGTIVGADTARLLDLIGRVPASRGYAWRWALPLELLYLLEWAYGDGVPWARLQKWWDETAVRATKIADRSPSRRYATLGEPQDLTLPLVVPTNLTDGRTLDKLLEILLEVPPKELASPRILDEVFRPMPDSLLFRLLLHARLVDTAEVVRFTVEASGPALEPIEAPDSEPTRLARWASQFSDAMVGSDPASLLFRIGREALGALPGLDPAVVERVLRATLDTASHRIDPWLTGVVTRRLRELTAAAEPARFQLGAYGWVDAPRPRDPAAPPPPAEYLHAPSMEQALTAAVLRDRALSDAEPARWQMDVDSDRVRLVEELAEQVRLGSHLTEVLGRAVERAVAAQADVERLRAQFPIRVEHTGRRVCDGQAVLDRYVTNPADLGLTGAQLDTLAPLAHAVDTYGDLLVAEAVHHVVSGRGATAATAMEAAAGLAAPPTLEVLRTRRGGRIARTTVVAALPAAAGPPAPDAFTSPGVLAEPAVAAFLEAQTGAPGTDPWRWEALDTADQPLGPVTLADLGLTPVDTLSLSAVNLYELALAAVEGAARLEPAALPAQAAAQRLADILGSRPVLPEDLVTGGPAAPGTEAALASLQAGVQAELHGRYSAVHALADDLRTWLVAAAADPADHTAALVGAARWGITPLRADGAPTATLVARAAAALSERLAKAPSPAAAAALAPATLASALAELVSPEGRLPVLSRLPLDQLPTALVPDVAGPAALDPYWLEVVSPVRAHLARFEAYQLSRHVRGLSPLAAWTNRPGDPWQREPRPDADADAPPVDTHLLAAFGPAGALDPAAGPARPVALGLVDSFSEVIPATDHTTTVAFHVDAPASRAPQAVLIAVPPDVDVPLDTETLVDVLADTRRLVRARAAAPPDLDALAAGTPSVLLPAHQPTGISLTK
ncbi:hypothetical protein ACG83_28270 [Frankia sp. R43]|uniref:hypothetical protein n=1 Tax=Frankia sp. R43 TaxID=269536 RepID=UPI0006CA4AA7|nr:hypothetical protein [Frankia sp. R43]KPM52302.1 hypothetical protein ACG83_28270 [Frankia sp. R43]